jgi:hypothetical protein
MEFSQEIAGRSKEPEFILEKTIEYFYPEVKDNFQDYMQEFAIALNTEKKKYIPYFVRLSKLNKAGGFIDAVTYADNKLYKELFQQILKPLWWFGKVDVNKINLYEGTRIMQSFITESTRLRNLTNISIIRHLRLQLAK